MWTGRTAPPLNTREIGFPQEVKGHTFHFRSHNQKLLFKMVLICNMSLWLGWSNLVTDWEKEMSLDPVSDCKKKTMASRIWESTRAEGLCHATNATGRNFTIGVMLI